MLVLAGTKEVRTFLVGVVSVGVALLAISLRQILSAIKLPHEPRPPQDKKIGRVFAWVVAVEVVGISLVGAVCYFSGNLSLSVPLVLIVVGIHFFPLARLFDVPRYTMLGVLFCTIPLLTLLMIPAEQHIGYVIARFLIASLGCATAAFALAYSFLGIYYTMQPNLGLKPAREVIPLAVAAEEQALRIDPSLPEAQALLAVCIGGFDYDWNKAEPHWRLAMAREPLSLDVLFWYGNHHLLPVGRTADAIEAMERGLQGDPLNLLYRHHYARGLRLANRQEDAEAELRSILEIDENYPHALATLGSICAQQQRYEEALVLTEKAHALMPWSSLTAGQLAAILVRSGDATRADALIKKLKTEDPPGATAGLACFYGLCGEIDQAAHWAERAIEQRDMPFIQNLGWLLRPTSHWPALAKLMNLPGQTELDA